MSGLQTITLIIPLVHCFWAIVFHLNSILVNHWDIPYSRILEVEFLIRDQIWMMIIYYQRA